MNVFTRSLMAVLIFLIGSELIASNTRIFWDEGSIPNKYTYEKSRKGRFIRDQKEFLKFAIKKDILKNCKNPFLKILLISPKKTKISSSVVQSINQNPYDSKQISQKYLVNGLFNPFIMEDLMKDIPSNVPPLRLLDIVSDPIVSLFKNKTGFVPLLDLFKNINKTENVLLGQNELDDLFRTKNEHVPLLSLFNLDIYQNKNL